MRAYWSLDGQPAFLISLWVRPDKNMFVVSVDSSGARALRTAEFQRRSLGQEHIGLILNVFDYDGDGWGETLMGHSGYEGFQLSLYHYRDSGLVSAVIELFWSC